MSEPPRDPLAEHPLTPDPARRRPSTRATLELFPDVSEKPLGPPQESAPSEFPIEPAPAAPAPEPAARERSKAGAPTFSEPEPAAGETEGPRAVAFARRV